MFHKIWTFKIHRGVRKKRAIKVLVQADNKHSQLQARIATHTHAHAKAKWRLLLNKEWCPLLRDVIRLLENQ